VNKNRRSGNRQAERREVATREARTREVGIREDNRVRGKSSRKHRTKTQEAAGKVILSITHFSELTSAGSNSARSDARLRLDHVQGSGTRRLEDHSKSPCLFL